MIYPLEFSENINEKSLISSNNIATQTFVCLPLRFEIVFLFPFFYVYGPMVERN